MLFGGKLHKVEMSSGKMAFHASTRKDGARSGDDTNDVNEGKKDWANSLLMVVAWMYEE